MIIVSWLFVSMVEENYGGIRWWILTIPPSLLIVYEIVEGQIGLIVNSNSDRLDGIPDSRCAKVIPTQINLKGGTLLSQIRLDQNRLN